MACYILEEEAGETEKQQTNKEKSRTYQIMMSAMEKIKQEEDRVFWKGCWQYWCNIFNKVVKDDVNEKMTSEIR